VLNIGRLGSDAAEYYIGEIATSAEDYYSGRGEASGRWIGSLAERLGLHGAVTSDHFRSVLAGRHPFTHEQLARRRGCAQVHRGRPNQPTLFDQEAFDVARVASRLRLTVGRVRQLLWAGDRAQAEQPPKRYLCGRRVPNGRRYSWLVPRVEVERFEAEHRSTKARPGYDITLRPPKSVSVLWALAPEVQRRAIRGAHREAVDAVVTHLERHAVFARQGTKDRARIETDGVIAAAFDHRTSRAGDPLLHTHVVTANLTRTAEGRWQAIDGRPLFQHARSAGFLYQAHLRQALSAALGVRWSGVCNGWAEIEGVPRAVVRAFSKRRDEIEEMVAEAGYTSARAHQAATLVSRRAKEYGVDADVLQARWREEAAALGFGPEEVAACFDQSPTRATMDLEALFRSMAGPAGLTRHASTFGRADVVEAVSEGLPGVPAEEIEAVVDAFLASSYVHALASQPDEPESVVRRDLVRSRSSDFARFSTPELLDLEHRLLSFAEDGFGAPVPTATVAAVDAAIATRPELSPEQLAMVRAVCLPGAEALQPVAGRPGSGKTYATAACVEALAGSGVPVVGCALSATAAAELESATRMEEKTGRAASTIARLLLDVDRHPLPSGVVVIVDEASMVGTRDLARLAGHVATAGGALKLIGDPDQHGAVESGGFFRRLTELRGDRLTRMEQNNRQLDADHRLAIEDFRRGLVESALSRYDATGRVVRSPNASAAYDAMVTDWWGCASVGETVPMIAGPNVTRSALNRRARALLKAEARLDGPMVVAHDREYCVGEWVVTKRNRRDLRSADGHFVKNGSAGVVTALDPKRRTLTVTFEREGVITLPAEYLDAGFVDYGYARTTYGVQGATLDRGLYFAGDEASFEEGYVALTRGRLDTRIYIVDGTSVFDEESSHRGHDPEQTGLDTVAQAMERRRANTLAAERDPAAADIVHELAGWGLRRLSDELARLDGILAEGPDDVTEALRTTVRRRDAVLARRQAWDAGAAAPRALRRSQRQPRQVGRELDRIERELATLEGRVDQLRARHTDRLEFLDAHRDVVERWRLVHRAIQAEELRVRIEAGRATDEFVAAFGPPPDDPAARQAWQLAAESVAVHVERHGRLVSGPHVDGADPRTALLGVRPREASARWSYLRAAQAVDALTDGRALTAADEVLVG
jgi:conjugative relaxase-like TrwC/TraI family protein